MEQIGERNSQHGFQISIHSFIYLFQITEVHRHTHKTYNIHRKKEHTKRDRQKETKHTHETRRTILLSQTDSLLAKHTLELCIKVLKLGSPRGVLYFPLVNNTILPSAVFHLWPTIGQIFASDRGEILFNVLSRGEPLNS